MPPRSYKAAQADWRAIKILLDMVQAIESRTEPASPETPVFSVADEKVIAQLKARLARPAVPSTAGAAVSGDLARNRGLVAGCGTG